MKKIAFINACIRNDESRTLRIADCIVQNLSQKHEVTEINLAKLTQSPVNEEEYLRRRLHGVSDSDRVYGKIVAQADVIVIAAPFWDMSFPSVLKVFIERISADGVTFANREDGNTEGICKADELLYITTRGMEIPSGDYRDQGSSYLKALCWLWGIPKIRTIAAYGLDVTDHIVREERIRTAILDGLQWCEEI